jgi:hypothetical protein
MSRKAPSKSSIHAMENVIYKRMARDYKLRDAAFSVVDFEAVTAAAIRFLKRGTNGLIVLEFVLERVKL